MMSYWSAQTNVIAFPSREGTRIKFLWACLKEIDELPFGYSLELEGSDIVLSHRNHVMGLWKEDRGFLAYMPLSQCVPAFITDHAAEAVRYTLLLIGAH